jgi:hypothetical protein
METNTGAKAWFNIQTGITGSLTGSNATITAVSGGWYRCALYFTSSVASGPQNIQYNLADANGNLSYAGVAGTGSYLWGAQFENGNVLGPYRATTTVGFTTGSMLDQMKFNLKNPADTNAGFRLTAGGTLNIGYSGFKGDGTSGYLNTNFNQLLNQSSNNLHISIYQRNILSGPSGVSMGLLSSGTFSRIYMNFVNEEYHSLASINQSLSSIETPQLGMFTLSRNSPLSFFKKQNNSPIETFTSAASTLTSLTYVLLANNANNVIEEFSSANLSFTTIGDGLTDYEAKALYWIVQKYQTTLGRQVY